MNKKRALPTPFGLSSVAVILCVLALAVFSVLALSSAAANRRLSEVSAETVSARAEAEREADRILALIRSGELPELVETSEDGFSYTVACGDSFALEVGTASLGNVTRWQFVRTAEWSPDDGLDLIDP